MQGGGVFSTWAESIRKLTCISFVSLLSDRGPCLTLVLFDGAIDEKVLKKVPKPQRNLITSIHYLHSEQSWGSPSVIRFICIVNTCPACLCLHVFLEAVFHGGGGEGGEQKRLTFPSKCINSTSSKNILSDNCLDNVLYDLETHLLLQQVRGKEIQVLRKQISVEKTDDR